VERGDLLLNPISLLMYVFGSTIYKAPRAASCSASIWRVATPEQRGFWVGLSALPNIDTDIEFTAFLRDGNLFAAGKMIGDGFPNAEVFLRDNRRTGHMLLRYQSPHGPSAGPLIRLPGAGTRNLGMFKEGITLNAHMQFIGTTLWSS
jgi:hypothetical protein